MFIWQYISVWTLLFSFIYTTQFHIWTSLVSVSGYALSSLKKCGYALLSFKKDQEFKIPSSIEKLIWPLLYPLIKSTQSELRLVLVWYELKRVSYN